MPAIESKGGFIALVKSKLIAMGSAVKTEPAIRIDGDILVLDLKTTGYARALQTSRGAAPSGAVETLNGGRTEIVGGHLYTYIDSKGATARCSSPKIQL